ncbi:MAG: hypothetical protein ACO3A2_09815 [Bdellovibrionia bacterium]
MKMIRGDRDRIKSLNQLSWMVFGLMMCSSTQASIQETLNDRAQREGLKTAIMGGLLYLDDTQIRERPGKGDPRTDSCTGDGCFPLPPGATSFFPLPLPFVKNLPGEWLNTIHVLPEALGRHNWRHESIIQVQDSNLFMTASTSYPLYFFDESEVLESGSDRSGSVQRREEHVVERMRGQALESILSYRRGSAFSFWPELPGSSSAARRVGPLNIPMALAYGQTISKMIPGIPKASGNSAFSEWFEDAFDRSLNPYGVDALANIPNDADDTSLAIALLQLGHRLDAKPAPDLAFLNELLQWRDQNRSLEDGRDGWKGKDSGGFLTWFKDENLGRSGRFLSPDTGVIPLGVNNVDCVVNANALFALGLMGVDSLDPIVIQVSELMSRAASLRLWPECGLYYPQRMIFPYVLSRAYRDAGIQNEPMKQAMNRLLFDLIREQLDYAKQNAHAQGAFWGGEDSTVDLSTALALSTLLNIGSDLAKTAGVLPQYEKAIEQAVAYLIQNQIEDRVSHDSTFRMKPAAGTPKADLGSRFHPGSSRQSRKWDSGLFFSASKWSLAQWRSEAYTTAIVVEALTKYVLGYDLRPGGLKDGARLKVKKYALSANQAGEDFIFELENSRD